MSSLFSQVRFTHVILFESNHMIYLTSFIKDLYPHDIFSLSMDRLLSQL